MKTFLTEIYAMCPQEGIMKTYLGPLVPGISYEDAQHNCENNGLGYCKMTGNLVTEIDTKDDGVNPDFSTRKDYVCYDN